MSERVSWGRRDPAWTGIDDHALTVAGHPVYALCHRGAGPAAGAVADGGPIQLLVHGLGGSAHNWLDVIGSLAELGPVIAVDLPGFGQTPLPKGGSARMRANAAFLEALLAGLDRRVVIHGQSMGGLIATLVAARRSDSGAAGAGSSNLAGLVLTNPALPAPPRWLWRQSFVVLSRIVPAALPGVGRWLVEAAYRVQDGQQLIEDSLAGTLGEAGEVRDVLRDVLVDNAEEGRRRPWRRRAIVEAARSLVAMHLRAGVLNDAVEAVDVPTLLLWGDADRLVSPRAFQAVVDRRPDWDLHVFAGVGHAPGLEVPGAYADVVSRWQRRAVDGV